MSTFISYSRANATFVVRLAKDLKAAGYDVWLDQLDIPKGARWDDEIEAAVEKSSTFMIVLAPESIESQNVKDELSYAIDAGKHILPVVIKSCKIPLRLRRFQYVDFTEKPYRDSLAQIKHLLSNSRPIPKVDVDPYLEREDPAPVFTGPLIQRDPVFQLEPINHVSQRPDVSQLRKFALPVLLAVVGIAAITGIVAYASNRNTPATITTTSIPNTAMIMVAATGTTSPPPEQITDRYGVTMRLVSAGDFVMGSKTGLEDERPVRTIYLDAFYIDKYEVTNQLYRSCVQTGACPSPRRVNSVTHVAYYSRPDFDHYPVVFVDWHMARSFCEWRGGRLPTEAEWEKAARGPEGRTYPWGGNISCNEANYAGCQSDTAAVSNYGSGLSPYGIYNMAGNVYEWVSSLYMPYPYDSTDGREELNTTGDRVIRGGSWIKSNTEQEVRSARRQRADPSVSTENIGFRCVNTFDSLVPVTGLPTATPKNSFTATSMAATDQVRRTKESENLASTPVPPGGPTQSDALAAPSISAADGIITPSEDVITPGSAGVLVDSDDVTPGDSSAGVTSPDPGQGDPQPDPGTDPQPDPGGDPQPDPGGDPQPDPGSDPQPDPGGDPQPDPGGDPQPDPGGDPQPDPGSDPPPDGG